MKIEILYVADCPSRPAAAKLVRDVLAAEGIVAETREVLVTDEGMARRLGFCGSPTIRINGKDVSPPPGTAPGFALSCRLYPGTVRVPPVEAVRQALLEAHRGAQA